MRAPVCSCGGKTIIVETTNRTDANGPYVQHTYQCLKCGRYHDLAVKKRGKK